MTSSAGDATRTCEACATANPADARFCGSCGANLSAREPCPRCGAENPSGQRFCNSCGLELSRAGADGPGPEPAPDPASPEPEQLVDEGGEGSEPDGERKQVTVLFADVKGSMELAEQTDTEEWRRIMRRFFELLSEAVRQFEGTVDKFTGDGIMALFGAPIAHEDHAQRACYAALQMIELAGEYAAELRRAHGLSFSIRIGINSGEVVAGAIGAAGEPEYTAVGHTVGLAQRMEALAEPGKAYLTEHAAALAEGYLELSDLGEFEVKGTSRPIRVYELTGVGSARSRLDLSRNRGFSAFVGRAEEMETLSSALERALAGRGGVVGIVAEPGVGKSRLCHEFAELCRARGISVYEAQGQAHGSAIPFMPVLQMLRAYFGIEEGDSDRQAREKIAGRMLLLDPDFNDDLPVVFDFLGVPDPERPVPQVGAEARERALRGVIRRLVKAPNRNETVINVIEDLHWMDEGSDAFLAELISAVDGTQTLAVVNFRPDYDAAWTDSPIYRCIPLVPLGPEATRELFADLAGEDPSLDGLAELIGERTGGNPFFIEEVVRELVESGALEGERGDYRLAGPVDEVRVPARVQSILAARIDRLPPSAKRVLQAASVIGREASEPALRVVSGLDGDELEGAVRELIENGFAYEAEIYPERVLAFCHPLTREVAYESQLSEQRASAHAAAARAMIELDVERHDELAALIAQHLEEGGETLEAARWSARAAHWAGYSHPQDALRLWRKVTELSSELPETDETAALGVSSRLLQLDYAWRLGMEHDRAESLVAEAREIATRTGDLRSLTLLKLLAAGRPGISRETGPWMANADEAISLADEAGDDHLRVAVRTAGSYAHWCAGDSAGMEALIDEAFEIAGDDLTMGAGIVIGCPLAWGLMAKGVARRDRCEWDAADELDERALRIATEQGDVETQGWTLGNMASTAAFRGDLDAAQARARRNYELVERLGGAFSRHWALVNLGIVRLARRDPAAALEVLEEADRVHREAMGSGGESGPLRSALIAEALLGVGRESEALERAASAAEEARELGLLWSLPRALRVLALARAATGEPGAAEALDEAVEVARRIGQEYALRLIEQDRAQGVGAA